MSPPRERKEHRLQVYLTTAELRSVLRLAARYTEQDRNAGTRQPGVTTSEAARRATLTLAACADIGDRLTKEMQAQWLAERPKPPKGRAG